ncbi:unnamed protein product [Prunus armeniaca]
MNGNLPTGKSEARKVQQKAARYYMHGNKLIRRSYSGPHLTYIKYPRAKFMTASVATTLGAGHLPRKL